MVCEPTTKEDYVGCGSKEANGGMTDRACIMCDEKLAENAGKLIFLVLLVAPDGGSKEKSCIRDLDLDPENKVKVRRSRNFNWPYLEHFSTEDDQNV